MPHYVFRALDRPGSDAIRAAVRERIASIFAWRTTDVAVFLPAPYLSVPTTR